MDIPSFKVEFIPKIGMYNLFSPKKEYKEVDLCIISNKNKEFLEFLINESIGKSFLYICFGCRGYIAREYKN